ncbi:MAG TPA: DUF58 domain-containing protein [Acidobacteriota bacterium]|nr:DUF58 domain-containing protein [Acidobacteriota bacterium]
MIVPRFRLIWWCALALPFLLIPAFARVTLVPCAAIVSAFVLVAAFDAWRVPNQLQGLRFESGGTVRLTKDRDGEIFIAIHNADEKQKVLRVGLPLPAHIDSEKEVISVRLPSGKPSSQIVVSCKGTLRGHFVINRIYYEISSPFGLWNARANAPIEIEIYVYPDLSKERKQVAALFLNRGAVGMHSQRIIGQGREFEKLREYIHGDSYDQIHWKATAKRGRPVTKIFQVERTQEVYVAIDSSRLSARPAGTETILEHQLRAALVLGMVAQRQGDNFGLVTFSDQVNGFLRAKNGKAHYNACRELLTSLHSRLVTPDFDDLFSFVRLRLRRRALIIILTDLSDPVQAERFVSGANLISRQHLVLVDMVRPLQSHLLFSEPDADSVDELYDKLAGHLLFQDTRELQNTLHRHGIVLSLLEDSRLTPDIVSQYINVKLRQTL